MSERVKGFTVVLKNDLREEDAQLLKSAISLLSGVLSVEAIAATSEDYFAEQRVRATIGDEILKILYPHLMGSEKQ